MTMYSASVELAKKGLTDDLAGDLMDKLVDYHPAIGASPRGWLHAQISLPAETLAQATSTAIAVVEAATGEKALRVDVMTEAEFAALESFTIPSELPDQLSVSEVAELLRLSPQRVRAMIEEGKFNTARRVGAAWTVELTEVQARVPKGKTEFEPFQFGNWKLNTLHIQDTEDLVDLNDRLNTAFDKLGFSETDDATMLFESGTLNLWLARVGDELQRRGVKS